MSLKLPQPHAQTQQVPERKTWGTKLWNVAGKSLVVAVGTTLSLASPAWSQTKDKVTQYNPRTERVVQVTGVVEMDALGGVTLRTGEDSTSNIDAQNVLRIVWGDVPQSFQDARTYWSRGDFESALAQYRLAASDGDARGVVQAASRLRAAESLMRLGAKDPARYTECVTEAQRYIDDHATGRNLPEAMQLKARAQWVLGKPAEATADFLALYEAGQAKTLGYSPILALEAGLSAAWTSLEGGDTGKARELFTACEAGFATAAEEALPAERHRLIGLSATAKTGEGYCLLTSGDNRGAIAFFDRTLGNADLAPAGKFSATLGKGEALLADDKPGEAQIHLARVSALDPSGRDRTARAMVGLAKCLRAVGGADADAQVTALLGKIKSSYGDTPAAFHASKLN